MIEKVFVTIFIAIWQILISVMSHKKYKNKKYDTANVIYQIILFILFQISIWIIVWLKVLKL